MTLQEIYDYIKNNKDRGYLKNVKLSTCRTKWFQISLIKEDKPYILSNVHFEVVMRDNRYSLEIHFEEKDTTRYFLDKQLKEIANKNNFEWFKWWTKGAKNQKNQSLRLEQNSIKQINNLEKFLQLIEDKHKIFNNILVRIAQQGKFNKDNSQMLNIKNIILYGSPGVGKTHNTNKLIQLIEDGKSDKEIFETIKSNEPSDSVDISDIKERVKFVTFHQSFGYEDFIEGFRPNDEGNIKLTKGIFREICEDADKDRDNIYYLVIDEINRANISKVFGELITLIEEDKRDILEVTLPYSKQSFKIPSNLYIIGTMNSTDKSIALIDIALRRRFTFLKMEPNAELITHQEAKNKFIALNQYISDSLGEDYQIGHSYFMNIESDDDLDFVLEYKIKPLLEEYFYGDDRLNNVLEIINR